MSHTLFIVFLFSVSALFLFRQIALVIGLVDKPDERKQHKGVIPLVGGLSVYIGISCYFLLVFFHRVDIPHFSLYLSCAGLLVFIGVLDDRFDVSVKLRAVVQAMVALFMMSAGLYLHTFGHILGIWELQLGPFGYVLTLFAVWAAINAFNMMDGIDGLLAGVSSVALLSLGAAFLLNEQTILAGWCFATVVALLPYCLLNLGAFGQRYKVFMGDAGSTLLGFTIIWLLLQSTQATLPTMNPVTALWIIAVPLIDMIAIMYRRLRKGMSPFAADRQHIHHLMIRIGFTTHQALIIITVSAAVLALLGLMGEYFFHLPEWLMLVLFLLVFFIYGYFVKHAWRYARRIKRTRRKKVTG